MQGFIIKCEWANEHHGMANMEYQFIDIKKGDLKTIGEILDAQDLQSLQLTLNNQTYTVWHDQHAVYEGRPNSVIRGNDGRLLFGSVIVTQMSDNGKVVDMDEQHQDPLRMTFGVYDPQPEEQ